MHLLNQFVHLNNDLPKTECGSTELTAVAHCRIVKAEAMMFVTNTVGKNVIIICKTTKNFSLKGLGHAKKNGMKQQNTT